MGTCRRLFALVLLAAGILAVERLDLYDPGGRFRGYVLIDEGTGRVDVYDARARRVGVGNTTLGAAGVLDFLTTRGFRLVPSRSRS